MKMDLGHLLVTLTLLFTGLQAAEWGYWGRIGPENWPGVCKTGKQQSPIDISTKDVVKTDNFGSLIFGRYNESSSATLENDGHSVEIELHDDDDPAYLSSANLQSKYILDHMHFHWNAEHTVNDFHDPLELHLVHYDNQYANLSIAAKHKNGLAVVSVLYQKDKYANPYLEPIVKTMREVLDRSGKSTAVQEKLRPLSFLPEDHVPYYYYQGSLTTPACDESVMWFVLANKSTVSSTQVNVFKRLRGDHGRQTFNNRPTQKLYDRKVYHYSG